MSKVTVWFIRCALVYFIAAMFAGIYMTVAGPVYPIMPIHTHLNLLGWITMMVYGVGYHILPRFSGAPLWSDKLSVIQLWTANIGLIGMVAGWVLLHYGAGFAALHVFALVSGFSAFLFVLNMFKTVKAAPAPAKK